MLKFYAYPITRQGQRVRLVKLALFSSPLMGAYFFSHTHQVPLLICPFRCLTGIPCPGCGMTRSFLALARGDWVDAVYFNLFGPVVFAGFFIAVIHLCWELITGQQIKTFYSKLIHDKKPQKIALFLVLTYHVDRLYYLSISGELSISFAHSPLGRLIYSTLATFTG